MGATLSALQDRGLLSRSADPHDGRRIIVAITEAGRQALHDRRSAKLERLAAALAEEFTTGELEQLLAAAPLLQRVGERL